MTTNNPIQQVVEAEKQATGILDQAQEKAKEIIDTAKKQATANIQEANEGKRNEVSQKLEKEKEIAKEGYRKAIEKIDAEVSHLEKNALGKINTAADKISSAFISLFVRK